MPAKLVLTFIAMGSLSNGLSNYAGVAVGHWTIDLIESSGEGTCSGIPPLAETRKIAWTLNTGRS
jgi:hypothetical protein